MAAAATSRMRTLAAAVAPLMVAVAVLLVLCASPAAGKLQIGYYNKTCPAAEQIGRAENTRAVRASPDLATALLRLHYHDCFVQGCDAHTLGKAHCPTFADRLYATAGCSVDPTLDTRYADRLRMRCTSAEDNNSTAAAASELDPGSCTKFDTSYYQHMVLRRGLLRSDASLLDNRFTRAYVLQAATGRYDSHFFHDFAVSMAKMASIGVITGDQGEIRKTCNVIK